MDSRPGRQRVSEGYRSGLTVWDLPPTCRGIMEIANCYWIELVVQYAAPLRIESTQKS